MLWLIFIIDHTLHCHLNLSISFLTCYIYLMSKKYIYYCSNVKLELTAKVRKTFYPRIFYILIRSQKILSQIRVMPFISAVNSGVEANWDWYNFSKLDLKRQRKHHTEMNSFSPLLFHALPADHNKKCKCCIIYAFSIMLVA